MTDRPAPELVDRVAAILGWTPTAWTHVRGGYTPADRHVVRRGGRSAFVKVATTPVTPGEVGTLTTFVSLCPPRHGKW